MQVLIDIPEEIYKYVRGELAESECHYDYNLTSWNAIHNGIPLPKGHGRLIDADYMNERILELPIDELASENAWAMKVLCLAPTIIEADTNS